MERKATGVPCKPLEPQEASREYTHSWTTKRNTDILDNLTIAIVAAVVGALTTVIVSQFTPNVMRILFERPKRWAGLRIQSSLHAYGLWRSRKIVRGWFDEGKQIIHLEIADYEGAVRGTSGRHSEIRIFRIMELKRGRFAPKLNDHLIAATIEKLSNSGTLVKVPEAQIGHPYTSVGEQPTDAKTYRIAHLGKSAIEARKYEEQGEEERCCVECHYWNLTARCPRRRYTFTKREESEGNVTRSFITTIKGEEADPCMRCWEKSDQLVSPQSKSTGTSSEEMPGPSPTSSTPPPTPDCPATRRPAS